jgi:hypothetical protein
MKRPSTEAALRFRLGSLPVLDHSIDVFLGELDGAVSAV